MSIFATPSFIVKNISNKDIRVLGRGTVKRGHTRDLFKIFEDISEDDILASLSAPFGDLYLEIVKKQTLQVLNYKLVGSATAASEGVFSIEANASSLVSTTSSSDILIPNLELSPDPGIYLAFASVSIGSSSASVSSSIISLYVNGVQVLNSERDVVVFGTLTETIASFTNYISVGFGEVVEVRWRLISGTDIETTGRSLTLIKAT